jgi:hypothetical protein
MELLAILAVQAAGLWWLASVQPRKPRRSRWISTSGCDWLT